MTDNVIEHSAFKKQQYMIQHSETFTRIELMDKLEAATELLSDAATAYTNAKVALKEYDQAHGIEYVEEDE